jgi:hypothetical protein
MTLTGMERRVALRLEPSKDALCRYAVPLRGILDSLQTLRLRVSMPVRVKPFAKGKGLLTSPAVCDDSLQPTFRIPLCTFRNKKADSCSGRQT